MSIGKKVSLAISKGLQGAAQGYQTGQQLQIQRQQAETQKAYAEAQMQEIGIKQQQQATAIESANRKQYYTTLGNIVKAPEAERKNVAKILLPEINKYAVGGHMTPFVNEDDLVTHSSVSEWSKSITDINEAKAAMPAIFAGQKTPEFANSMFEKARASLQTQRQFAAGNKEDLDSLKKDSDDLENVYQKYVEKYGKQAEANAPAASLDGKPISAKQFSVIKDAGGVEATGQLDKAGLPVIGKKPKDTSRQDGINDRFTETQVNKLSDKLGKARIPEIEAALGEVAKVITFDAKGEPSIPGYGLGTQALKKFFLSDEGARTRTQIQDTANIILQARSGAAVTDPEYKRFLEAFSTGTGFDGVLASSKMVRNGLEKMYQDVNAQKTNLSKGFSKKVIDTYMQNSDQAGFVTPNPYAQGKKEVAPIDGFDLSGFK